MVDQEPTELVSCGRCQTVNNVPFGLDKFKCYSCGIMVAISREASAACAAASPTALYYTAQQEAQANAGHSAQAQRTSTASATSESSKASGGGGFFGKLQKTMDKTMQKVEKNFMSLAGGSTASNVPAKSANSANGTGSRSTDGAPDLSAEEEQLQWALRASLEEEERRASASEAPPQTTGGGNFGSVAGRAPTSTAAAAGISNDVAQALQAAEVRATRAERELGAAQAREKAALAEREQLRKQLEENEGLIRGLTAELDAVNGRLQAQKFEYETLERSLATTQKSLATARASATRASQEASMREEANAEEEELAQGTIAQLLQRIAELEATLLRATHFAPADGVPAPTATEVNTKQDAPLEQEHIPASQGETLPSAATSRDDVAGDVGAAVSEAEEALAGNAGMPVAEEVAVRDDSVAEIEPATACDASTSDTSKPASAARDASTAEIGNPVACDGSPGKVEIPASCDTSTTEADKPVACDSSAEMVKAAEHDVSLPRTDAESDSAMEFNPPSRVQANPLDSQAPAVDDVIVNDVNPGDGGGEQMAAVHASPQAVEPDQVEHKEAKPIES